MPYYLVFKYGVMNSSKTANLLMTAHSLRAQGKRVILIKPSADSREGKRLITSRVGLKAIADIVLFPHNFPLEYKSSRFKTLIEEHPLDLCAGLSMIKEIDKIDMILVDEAQFLTSENVELLRNIASRHKKHIICFGLLTDYRSQLFQGSKRLVELADKIQEISDDDIGDCSSCKNNKAIINSKFHMVNKEIVIIKQGSDLPDVGFENKYKILCWNCWKNN